MRITGDKWGAAAALVSGCSFATLAIFSKIAYQGGANIPSVLLARFSGAALMFWLYFILKREKAAYGRNTILKLMLMGALGYGSMSAFFLLAVSRIPAALAAVLLYFYPALVTVATAALRQESFNMQKGGALAVTFMGMVLVLGASFEGCDLVGVLYGIGAPLVYTTYIVAGSRVLQSLEPIKATTYIMTGAAAAYILFGLLGGGLDFSYNTQAWLAIGGMILISTVLAVASFWIGVKWIGPSKTSIISTVEPLFTVLLAWLIFDEILTGMQLLGGIMIIAGVIILQYPVKPVKHESGYESKT